MASELARDNSMRYSFAFHSSAQNSKNNNKAEWTNGIRDTDEIPAKHSITDENHIYKSKEKEIEEINTAALAHESFFSLFQVAAYPFSFCSPNFKREWAHMNVFHRFTSIFISSVRIGSVRFHSVPFSNSTLFQMDFLFYFIFLYFAYNFEANRYIVVE